MSNGGYQQIPIPRPAWAGELSAAAEGLMFGLAIGTAFIRLSWGLFPLANAAADTIVLSLALWLGSAIVFAAAAATGAGAIHRSIEGPSPYGGRQVGPPPWPPGRWPRDLFVAIAIFLAAVLLLLV